jgi:glycosyltransferase involved in cell wall biosynthesis
MSGIDPPRIAVFLPNVEGGGAEQVMVTLANAFARRGFSVDLVLVSARGEYLSKVSPSVRIIDLGKSRVSASVLAFSRYIRQQRPQAILAALSHANIVALLARRLSAHQPTVVISERTSFTSYGKYNRSLKERLIRLGMRLTYRWADAITVVAEPIISEISASLRLDRARVHYIPNPIVSPSLYQMAQEPPPHPWLADTFPPVILGVGRLSREKGFDILIRAFAEVRRQRPARLLIFGKGPQREELEKLVMDLDVKADTCLPGFTSNPFAAMRRAGAFVLPSRFEGMPGSLIQAMACGTRVVSSDCRTGPREVLEGGRWGRLVPVENHTLLAQAIIDALDDPNPPQAISRAAVFDEKKSTDQYLSVMGLDLMAARSPGE